MEKKDSTLIQTNIENGSIDPFVIGAVSQSN